MDFLSLSKKRYSVRKYLSKPVENEKLDAILSACQAAPTAANLQPHKLIVVKTKEGLSKLEKAANVFGAPLAIIVCADKSKAWTRPFDLKNTFDIDAAIVTDHMMLEATDLGLGSVWICYFKPDVLRSEFNIPDNLEPVNILAIGYADGELQSPDRHSKTRKSITETVLKYK